MQALLTLRPRARTLLAIATVVAAVLIAVAFALSGPSPSAPAVASPTAAGAEATAVPSLAVSDPPRPTASAVATASPSPKSVARPGLISRRGDQPIVVRAETDATPIRTVPSFSFWSDGSRLAYWTENAGAAELHVLELAGGDRVLATFRDYRPGGIAWSTDGSGVLVSLAEPGDPRFLIPRILVAVDLASGASREVYQGIGPSGASVIPLVWRRDPEIYAAYETGPGGFHFGYTVIRPGQPPVRTDPEGRVGGMAASADGSKVLAFWSDESAIKVWPVDDFSKKTELKATLPEQFAQPRWWPGRDAIAFDVARSSEGAFRDRRVERWDLASGARQVLKRLPDGGALGAYFIRADGSGLVTLGPAGSWEVTDLRTGTSVAISTAQGENILGTVLLR